LSSVDASSSGTLVAPPVLPLLLVRAVLSFLAGGGVILFGTDFYFFSQKKMKRSTNRFVFSAFVLFCGFQSGSRRNQTAT